MHASIKSTRQLGTTNGCKLIVYGASGAGKTRLAASAQNCLVISAEKGLLSLRKFDIPAWEISNLNGLHEAYKYLSSSAEGKRWQTVIVDSASDVAEVIFTDEQKKQRDPRKLYPIVQDKVTQAFRDFRDLTGRNVVLLAKMEVVQDAAGSRFHQPMFPGNKLAQAAPYFVDEVFYLYPFFDNNNNRCWAFQTGLSDTHTAKDRSGTLNFLENADPATGGGLDYIFRKMTS